MAAIISGPQNISVAAFERKLGNDGRDHFPYMRNIFLQCNPPIEWVCETGRDVTYLVVCVGVPVRVLAQDRDDAPSALVPDPSARLAALWIVEPRVELVGGHVDVLVEERDDFCVGFAHGFVGGRERE